MVENVREFDSTKKKHEKYNWKLLMVGFTDPI